MLVVVVPMAVCYPLVKTGLQFVPPLWFAGMRTILGGLALLLVLAIRRQPIWPAARLVWWIPPLGALATTLTFGTMFASQAYTSAGIASVLGNIQPLLIIVLAALWLGERINLNKAMALLLGLAGVTMLALPAWRETTGNGSYGVVLALGSSVGAAAASVMIKKLQAGRDLMALTGWQLVVGGFALLGLSATFEPRADIRWTAEFAGMLLFLALFGTAMSTWLWFWLLERAEVGRLSLYLFLVPVFGLFASMLSLGERLTVAQMGGVGVILLAVAWSMCGLGAGRRGQGDRPRQDIST